MKKDRTAWAETIEKAVGPEIGTRKQRRAFARSTFAVLSRSLIAGAVAEAAVGDSRKIAEVSLGALEAFTALKELVDTGPMLVLQLHSKSEAIAARSAKGYLPEAPVWRAELERIGVYLKVFSERAEALQHKKEPARRGPRDTRAVAVATALAESYRQHFGKAPTRAKRARGGNDSKLPSPFDRVCDAVERLRNDQGMPLRISETARGKAIENTRASAGPANPR